MKSLRSYTYMFFKCNSKYALTDFLFFRKKFISLRWIFLIHLRVYLFRCIYFFVFIVNLFIQRNVDIFTKLRKGWKLYKQNNTSLLFLSLRRNQQYWRTIRETPFHALNTLRFSLETPHFSLETTHFSLENPIFSLENPGV